MQGTGRNKIGSKCGSKDEVSGHELNTGAGTAEIERKMLFEGYLCTCRIRKHREV